MKIIIQNKCCFLLLMLLLFSGCTLAQDAHVAVLSWEQEPLENSQKVMRDLSHHQIDRLYQYSGKVSDAAEWHELLKQADEHKIELYAMDGEPAWSLEEDGASVKKALDNLHHLNVQFSDQPIKGILLDIEPYALPQWENERDEVMHQYGKVVQIAYTHAQKYGFDLVLCIPYYLDDLGYLEDLEDLMPYCDELCIMNYLKKDEWGQIAAEITLARQYDKPVMVLYELQKPGSFDLTAEQTYYEDGIQAVEQSFARLQKQARGVQLKYGFHEYQSFSVLILDEKGSRTYDE